MKKSILLFALPLLAFFACKKAKTNCTDPDQIKEADVPAAVITSLHNAYPGVSTIDWFLENGSYEATFSFNNAQTSALFNASGIRTEEETEILVDKLPMPVKDKLAANYSDYTQLNYAKIVNLASGAVKYEVEMKKGNVRMDFIFDPMGVLLEQVALDGEC
ncbi:MAG: hypothetical protein GC192_15395 [Bacteroidetes bacterium]|nr:hypothetical protein [Bacteroidota bacterium]